MKCDSNTQLYFWLHVALFLILHNWWHIKSPKFYSSKWRLDGKIAFMLCHKFRAHTGLAELASNKTPVYYQFYKTIVLTNGNVHCIDVGNFHVRIFATHVWRPIDHLNEGYSRLHDLKCHDFFSQIVQVFFLFWLLLYQEVYVVNCWSNTKAPF